MNSPRVSVIIPNYNYQEFVCKTVDSVLMQTYQNLEIIVVDDGSKDSSREILRAYGDKIKVIEQVNQGVSRARNNGVAQSKGDFVAFLDSDDLWLPTKLEKQMKKFQKDTDIGLVHCSMKLIDREENDCGVIDQGAEGWVADEFLKYERGVVIGAGSTSLLPRRVFDEVGGFDPRQTTAADWDFSYRVASKCKIGFVPENLVLYRLHGSNMHANIKSMERDMMLGYKKAFTNGAKANRGECYGNLHRSLAGSYFRSGDYAEFAKHAVKSVWHKPTGIGYFLRFPLRRLHQPHYPAKQDTYGVPPS
jgi:glycosyltransferase involved in cell wall biosynthesis